MRKRPPSNAISGGRDGSLPVGRASSLGAAPAPSLGPAAADARCSAPASAVRETRRARCSRSSPACWLRSGGRSPAAAEMGLRGPRCSAFAGAGWGPPGGGSPAAAGVGLLGVCCSAFAGAGVGAAGGRFACCRGGGAAAERSAVGRRREGAVGAQVAGRERGAAEQDSPVRVELDRDPVERHAVVDAAARRLAHAVGRHDAHARRLRPLPRPLVQRRAADEHGRVAAEGVERGRRRCGRRRCGRPSVRLLRSLQQGDLPATEWQQGDLPATTGARHHPRTPRPGSAAAASAPGWCSAARGRARLSPRRTRRAGIPRAGPARRARPPRAAP